jgi:ferric-dicitrate binding protein FerR (iron transport regulator)
MRSYSTGPGERTVVSLPDGSRVTLAPNTQLRVTAGYGRTVRDVSVEGQAYFDVISHAAPFLVHAGRITTRVLGTTFDIQHLSPAAPVRVAVLSGKVSVTNDGTRRSQLTLIAGNIGEITDSTAIHLPGDPAQAATWVRGYVVFRDAKTADVLAMLTRWYGYRFVVADSTLSNQYLNVWLSTKSSAEALATLRLALDAELSVREQVITLRPRRIAPRAVPRTPSIDNSLTEVGR